MTALTVYDPPMCCSTGVCGPEVDQRLVTFAADLDWLKAQGVAVRRISLSQEPMAFVEQPAIRALMDVSGGDDLPAIMVGDRIVSQGCYPARAALAAIAGISGAEAAGQDQGAKAATSCCGGAKTAPAAAPASCCGGRAETDAAPKARACDCC